MVLVTKNVDVSSGIEWDTVKVHNFHFQRFRIKIDSVAKDRLSRDVLEVEY